MTVPHSIQFREPISIDELRSLLEFRQDVYAADEHLSSMIDHGQKLDLDGFDHRSFHFGAFDNGSPVAYIRFTVMRANHQTKWVESLIDEVDQNIVSIDVGFPFQNYHPDQLWSDKLIHSLGDRVYGEVGKLAVKSNAKSNPDLLKRFISEFLEYSVKDIGVQTGFGSCTLVLERFYRQFGFYRAEGSHPFDYKGLPKAVILRFDP